MIRILILTLALVAYANGHAEMTDPTQRGLLGGASKFAPGVKPIPGAPNDHWGHFPAGDKSNVPGAGKRSQVREAGGPWTPYEPLKPGFRFRAGVCGDLKSKPEHLRGGKYYFGGRITKTYEQGDVIEVRQAVVAHHNGYVRLHICDVAKCGGEISEKCFRDGHCYPLERAPNPVCDNGMSKHCGPIDKKNPTRWYLPCTSQVNDEGWDDYQGQYAKFKLPDFLSCEHCVIQWFYTAANNCNPPGVVEYFKGPDGPKNWGQCPGQAGAKGGFTQVQNDCGTKGAGGNGDDFPEEYYQCADVKIEPSSGARSGSSDSDGPSTSAPTTEAPSTEAPKTRAPRPTKTPTPEPIMDKSSTSVFKYFNLIADGDIARSFTTSLTIDISKYKKVAIEAVTVRAVSPVDFYIDGRKVWDEGTRPYFLYGNSGSQPRYFSKDRLNAVINRSFKLEARSGGDSLAATVRMNR